MTVINAAANLYDMTDVFRAETPTPPPAPQYYTVTAGVAGGHGTVTPGSVSVKENGSATFIITPDEGYQIKDITVDGVSHWTRFSLRGMDLSVWLPVKGCTHVLYHEDEIPATCVSIGIREYWVCGLCETVFLDELGENSVTDYAELETELDPMNHAEDEPVLVNVKEAACLEAGYTGDQICMFCGQILFEGVEIEPLEHQYGEDGICVVCGTANGEEILPDIDDTDFEEEPESIIQTTNTVSYSPRANDNSFVFTLPDVKANHRVVVTFGKLSPVIEQPVTYENGTATVTVTDEEIQSAIHAVNELNDGEGTITIVPTQSTRTAPVSVELPTAGSGGDGYPRRETLRHGYRNGRSRYPKYAGTIWRLHEYIRVGAA